MKCLQMDFCISVCDGQVYILFWFSVNSMKFFMVLLRKLLFLVIMLVKKMLGDLLFSFSVIGIRFWLVYCMIRWLVLVLLVKVILVMCGLLVSGLFVFRLKLLMMLSMFGGSRLLMIFISIKIEVGVCLVGLSIMQLLVVSVGVSFQVVISNGKFYGMIWLIMFSGLWKWQVMVFLLIFDRLFFCVCIMFVKQWKWLIISGMLVLRVLWIGLLLFQVLVCVISFRFCLMWLVMWLRRLVCLVVECLFQFFLVVWVVFSVVLMLLVLECVIEVSILLVIGVMLLKYWLLCGVIYWLLMQLLQWGLNSVLGLVGLVEGEGGIEVMVFIGGIFWMVWIIWDLFGYCNECVNFVGVVVYYVVWWYQCWWFFGGMLQCISGCYGI